MSNNCDPLDDAGTCNHTLSRPYMPETLPRVMIHVLHISCTSNAQEDLRIHPMIRKIARG